MTILLWNGLWLIFGIGVIDLNCPGIWYDVTVLYGFSEGAMAMPLKLFLLKKFFKTSLCC
jgi:hypothetical protein